MEVALVRVSASGSMTRVPIHKQRTVFGRQDECQVRIRAAGVSRKHCEIVVEDGSITINDLGSSNGTFVNQEKVTSQPLAAGDLVCVGGLVFLIQVNGEPEELDAELLYEDGIPEGQSTAAAPTSVPAPVGGGDLDESSMMDFDFEDDDDEQPPL